MESLIVSLGFVFVAIIILLKTAVVVPQQNGYVIERLGKYAKTLNAGFHILIPFLERIAYKHTLKEQAVDIAEQICITNDNVQVLDKNNVMVCDSRGVIYKGRTDYMDEYKEGYAIDTEKRTLGEAIAGTDVFLGLSAGNVLKPEMVESMTAKPIVFALANPTPEIDPAEARRVCPDVVLATGRTDYPNQVNNVLCFPFLFRGALDAGATEINQAMKIACVEAISRLARAGTSDVVGQVKRV